MASIYFSEYSFAVWLSVTLVHRLWGIPLGAGLPLELASTETLVSLLGLKNFSTGAFVMYRLSAENATFCCFSQCHSQSFSSSVLRGAEVWE